MKVCWKREGERKKENAAAAATGIPSANDHWSKVQLLSPLSTAEDTNSDHRFGADMFLLLSALLCLATVSRGEDEDIVFAGKSIPDFASRKLIHFPGSAHDPDIWGPTFFYANGQYYGQTLCSDGQGATRGRDCEVPHGNGTYVSTEGREIYSGEWWQGEREQGKAVGKKDTGKSADLFFSQTNYIYIP